MSESGELQPEEDAFPEVDPEDVDDPENIYARSSAEEQALHEIDPDDYPEDEDDGPDPYPVEENPVTGRGTH